MTAVVEHSMVLVGERVVIRRRAVDDLGAHGVVVDDLTDLEVVLVGGRLVIRRAVEDFPAEGAGGLAPDAGLVDHSVIRDALGVVIREQRVDLGKITGDRNEATA